MKQVLLFIFFTIPLYSISQSSLVIDRMAALYEQKIPSDVNQLFITDQNEGGLFYKYKGAAAVDSGVIISDAAGNKFKRQFDEAGAISPVWWGAKGDAIADDLPALKKATNYLGTSGGTIDLKNKYYRITDTWILGERFIDEKNAYNSNPTRSPDYNHPKSFYYSTSD